VELLTEVVAWLNAPALFIAGVAVSRAELLGDVAGVLCVWLVARQNVWNWPLGLVNTALWALVFFGARLYGDAVLQGIFFALGIYGWWRWTHGGERAPTLPVRRVRRAEAWILGVATLVATAAIALFLARRTDSPAPLPDAAVLTLSVAATYGQAQKLIESWWVWIAVDVISVPLYVSRELYPTAAVYVVFLLLCVQGLRAWTRDLEGQACTA
jgi:nicotinamide mononucleotide transporter